MQPAAVSEGHEWALLHVVPIKDAAARAKAIPMPLRRRQRGGGQRSGWHVRIRRAPHCVGGAGAHGSPGGAHIRRA
eukprot:1904348-Pleurochrysis_carterae.AAC.2